ncbi:MAG: hypothetical protein JWM44_4186 [Bacilli bacterium]|nr:hypothetical protein [Bacilli bacterium]
MIKRDKQKLDLEYEKFNMHFPEINQEVKDWVTNVILLKSRYIFTQRAAGVQFGYCTFCKKRYRTPNLKQGQEYVCHSCNSKCKVKASGVSRKSLIDSAYIVYYEKSAIDSKIMIARGVYVANDFRGKFKDIETKYVDSSKYLFESGNSEMYHRSTWSDIGWSKQDSVHSEFCNYRNWSPVYCFEKTIKEAVKGTHFQYSTWEMYTRTENADMVKFFGLFCKYPCIEYLSKLEYKYFVSAKLLGHKTFGAIDWNGKSVEKILKLNKQDLRILVDTKLNIKPLTLRLFQMTRKDNNRFTLEKLHDFTESTQDCFEELKKLFKQVKGLDVPKNLTDTIVYINRQFNRKSEKKNYANVAGVMITWRDYITDCITLELDVKQESVLFPINLFAAHQRTSVLVDVKVNAVDNEKILKRCEELEKYTFEYAGMIIRPAASCKEVIDEGKILGICIGSYAKRYAEGKTTLFFIRKVDDLDTPFFAMEVNNSNKIIQTQGKSHCQPTREVQIFIQAFTAEKLMKKSEIIQVAV